MIESYKGTPMFKLVRNTCMWHWNVNGKRRHFFINTQFFIFYLFFILEFVTLILLSSKLSYHSQAFKFQR